MRSDSIRTTSLLRPKQGKTVRMEVPNSPAAPAHSPFRYVNGMLPSAGAAAHSSATALTGRYVDTASSMYMLMLPRNTSIAMNDHVSAPGWPTARVRLNRPNAGSKTKGGEEREGMGEGTVKRLDNLVSSSFQRTVWQDRKVASITDSVGRPG